MTENDIEYFEVKGQGDAPKTFSIQKRKLSQKSRQDKAKKLRNLLQVPLSAKNVLWQSDFKYIRGISYELKITGKILILKNVSITD